MLVVKLCPSTRLGFELLVSSVVDDWDSRFTALRIKERNVVFNIQDHRSAIRPHEGRMNRERVPMKDIAELNASISDRKHIR